MSVEGLMAASVLLAIVALIVVAPLLRRDSDHADDARLQKQRERLLVYYERVLTKIRDLDEDHATGKMLDVDYGQEREEWVQRGIHVLRALDNLHAQNIIPEAITDDAAVDEAIDDAIEAAIKAYRGVATTGDKSVSAAP